MNSQFDIKKRKKELIQENILSAPFAANGRKRVTISILTILILRFVFLIFDNIYLGVVGGENNIWIQLLILPLILVLYMIYDGNRAMVYTLMISAPLRLIYHFTVILPSLPTEGVTTYTIIYMTVFEIQFGFAIFMSASSRCETYFTTMQKINLKLRAEMLGKK